MSPQPSGAIFYRSMAAATRMPDARRRVKWIGSETYLCSYVGTDLPGVGIPDLRFPADPHRVTDDMVDEAASAVREHWELGEGRYRQRDPFAGKPRRRGVPI